jgi:hypothetical protein
MDLGSERQSFLTDAAICSITIPILVFEQRCLVSYLNTKYQIIYGNILQRHQRP